MGNARRNGRKKSTLVALLTVCVVLAVAVAVERAWRPSNEKLDIRSGQAVTDRFPERIRNGQTDDAWLSTTADFKSIDGRESFGRYVTNHPILSMPVRLVAMHAVTMQGQSRAEYLYRSSESDDMIRIIASPKNKTWQVDRIIAD